MMWYYMFNDQQTGPVSDSDFRQLIASGQISAATPVWKEGMAVWSAAQSVPELAGAFAPQRAVPGATPNMGGAYPPNNLPGFAPNIPDYLVWSIVELLCCCMPFGIVALIFSIQANSAKGVGNYAEAAQKANTAKQFLIWGAVIGGLVNLLLIGLQILAAIAEAQAM